MMRVTLTAEEAKLTTDFPSSCTPVRAGKSTPEVAELAARGAAHDYTDRAIARSNRFNLKEET